MTVTYFTKKRAGASKSERLRRRTDRPLNFAGREPKSRSWPVAASDKVSIDPLPFHGLFIGALPGADLAMVTLKDCRRPLRITSTTTSIPGFASTTNFRSSALFFTRLPANRIITSPISSPAFSAGEPGSIRETSAPLVPRDCNDVAAFDNRLASRTPARRHLGLRRATTNTANTPMIAANRERIAQVKLTFLHSYWRRAERRNRELTGPCAEGRGVRAAEHGRR